MPKGIEYLKYRMLVGGLPPLRTQAEVAQMLGISQQAVSKTEDRALLKVERKLRELAKEIDDDPGDFDSDEAVADDMFLDWRDRKSTGGQYGRIIWKC